LRLAICSQGRTREAEQTLIVAPSACVTPSRRSFGIVANLYSVRSARNWGVGNLGDLGELARWSGERGATFVGVNPLHAIRNRGGEVSPYNPVSRLYRNPIYLDIEAIPELADCAEARAMLASESVRAELARLRAGDYVAYERIASLERPILAALHRAFVERNAGDPGTLGPRGRAYAVYLEREGAALTAFALFQALDEHFARSRVVPPTWHEWPAPYRNPASPEVAAFRESHESEVDFHRWLQFELDRQLALAALSGRRAGLSMGLYQDLAVASAASGSDAWAHQNLFAIGVSIGAPPDNYSAIGQDWGAPPLNPHRLFEDRYRYWIALVRSALRHAGALRIDHVLGLFRQFWIPAGMTGERGAYVRFPTNDLLGIVALESLRHRAVIVGEDLGTVPAEVPGILGQWGILGTRVMFFERETDGAFRPASSYEPLALATADTHDMPTVAGFWQERDIDLKRELGLLKSGAEERAARLARERDRLALLARLTADGALPSGGAPPSGTELRGAVHRFICSTPAVLAGISLDDITGETDQVNVPGLGADTFPSWTRRMRAPLESLEASPEVDEALRCAR
ncbi:MAG TPA: 4-alpha-glucanotransferase, partial [Gemmatimonadaceae bacterium]